MKKIVKIKLNKLNKANLTEREMSSLQGGNHCAFGDSNKRANESANVCSCACFDDYYGTSLSLNTLASLFKTYL